MQKKQVILFFLLFLCVLRDLRGEPSSPKMEVRGIALAEQGRGASYGSDQCRKQIAAIKEMGGNYIAISPFAWMRSVNDPHVTYRRGRDWDEANMTQCIADAHAMGLKVMLKPHIWCNEFWGANKWHGDIQMKSEEDWDTWFEEYGGYILANAKIADAAKADSLCIGVEYQGTSKTQEKRWRKLIGDVRAVYKGPLTYAASWGEYPDVQWWDALDCIGVDAYFPLALQAHPTDEDLRAGWQKVYVDLEKTSKRFGKPVCFTEIGYSESTQAAAEPWKYAVNERDPELQARLFRIALEEASKQDFVRGVFVWKWFTNDITPGRRRGDPFTIQNSPLVIDAMKSAWGK
jgi:hypothetical protein